MTTTQTTFFSNLTTAHLDVHKKCAFDKYNNQQETALAWSESTGESRGGFVFRRGKIDFFGGVMGDKWRGILRPGGRIRPHRPVAPLKNITINERPRWRGQNPPGDRGAASFLGGVKCFFLGSTGGKIEGPFRYQVME